MRHTNRNAMDKKRNLVINWRWPKTSNDCERFATVFVQKLDEVPVEEAFEFAMREVTNYPRTLA